MLEKHLTTLDWYVLTWVWFQDPSGPTPDKRAAKAAEEEESKDEEPEAEEEEEEEEDEEMVDPKDKLEEGKLLSFYTGSTLEQIWEITRTHYLGTFGIFEAASGLQVLHYEDRG